MTETAQEVIEAALQEILVQASEAPIEASDAQVAIKYLNRMMAKYDALGISLGYTAVTSLSDDVTIPDGAVEGVVKNLALALFPQYNAPGAVPSAMLVMDAKDGLDAMRSLSISIGPMLYPDTLPIGSGNEWTEDEHFYTDSEEPILSEVGGFISVESDTEL